MCAGWSGQASLLIEGRGVLSRAEQAFMDDWANMLNEVYQRFSQKQRLCRLCGNPPTYLQLYRKEWPGGELQVHFEVLCNFGSFRRGMVDFSLHLEHETPQQVAVCNRIRSLLRPYSDRVHSLLSGYIPRMPDQPIQDILKGQLPLDRVTPNVICHALEAMMQTESFVDETLFLAGSRTVWRTTFESSEPSVNPKWFGNVGGQRFAPGMGPRKE